MTPRSSFFLLFFESEALSPRLKGEEGSGQGTGGGVGGRADRGGRG